MALTIASKIPAVAMQNSTTIPCLNPSHTPIEPINFASPAPPPAKRNNNTYGIASRIHAAAASARPDKPPVQAAQSNPTVSNGIVRAFGIRLVRRSEYAATSEAPITAPHWNMAKLSSVMLDINSTRIPPKSHIKFGSYVVVFLMYFHRLLIRVC